MKRKKPVTIDAIKSEQIISDYKQGMGVDELSEAYGVSLSTVYKQLRLHGFGTSQEEAKKRRSEGVRKKPTVYAPPQKYAWHLDYERKKK